MLNIREFNHKLINVSHVEIGIQLIKLCNVEVPFFGVSFWKLLKLRKTRTWITQKSIANGSVSRNNFSYII